MKRLYLHIGLGKTGSSALQSWLSLNAEALSLQGIDYADTVPEVKFGESLSGNGSPLHGACVDQDFEEVERLLTSTYFFRPENEVAIISCELLQGIRPSTIETIREICGRNNIEIKVIAYVRSVYEVLYSTYTQFVKRSSYTHSFGEKTSDVDFATTVDYLKRYLAVFGANLIVLNYDAAKENIYASFSEVTGIKLKGLKKLTSKINRSLSFAEVETLRRVNALHQGAFSTQISNFIIAKSPSIKTPVFYDEGLVRQVRLDTASDVQWLNEQFSVNPPLVTDFYSGQKNEQVKSPTRASYQPVVQWSLDYLPTERQLADFAHFLKGFAAVMVEFSSDDALALLRRAHVVQKDIKEDTEAPPEGEGERKRALLEPRYLMTYFHDVNSPEIKAENSQFAANFYAWLDLIDAHTEGSTISPVEDTRILGSAAAAATGHRPPMSGFSVIKTEGMEEALALARKCPLLDIGGIVEVSHVVQLHRAYKAQVMDEHQVEEN